MSRVGIVLDFVWRSGTARTKGPHGAYVRGAKRNRIAPRGGGIERPVTRLTTPPLCRLGLLSTGLAAALISACVQASDVVYASTCVCVPAREKER